MPVVDSDSSGYEPNLVGRKRVRRSRSQRDSAKRRCESNKRKEVDTGASHKVARLHCFKPCDGYSETPSILERENQVETKQRPVALLREDLVKIEFRPEDHIRLSPVTVLLRSGRSLVAESTASGGSQFCRYCRSSLPSRARLLQHFKLVHAGEIGVEECKKCGLSLYDQKHRSRHHCKHHQNLRVVDYFEKGQRELDNMKKNIDRNFKMEKDLMVTARRWISEGNSDEPLMNELRL